MEYVVVIDTDGLMIGLWSDELIGLYEVEKGGAQISVERASHIEPVVFMAGVRWQVFEADGTRLMTYHYFQTRELALAWEKKEIERRLIDGVA